MSSMPPRTTVGSSLEDRGAPPTATADGRGLEEDSRGACRSTSGPLTRVAAFKPSTRSSAAAAAAPWSPPPGEGAATGAAGATLEDDDAAAGAAPWPERGAVNLTVVMRVRLVRFPEVHTSSYAFPSASTKAAIPFGSPSLYSPWYFAPFTK